PPSGAFWGLSTDIFRVVGKMSDFLATGRQSVLSPIEITPPTNVNLESGFQLLAVGFGENLQNPAPQNPLEIPCHSSRNACKQRNSCPQFGRPKSFPMARRR